MPTLLTTCTPFSSGITSITGNGQTDTFTFTGTWAAGDEYTITLTNSFSGVQYQYGFGQATGQQPTFCFTYQNKIYFLSGPTVYFSTAGNPVQFNDVTSGSPTDGFVTMSDQFSTYEPLISIAAYQGRLAFFARNNIQIWSVNASPSLWAQVQPMQNIGTLAKASVQSLGDLDVLFLADTGFRSLRVRDSSLNAFVNDIGSPIDDLVQSDLIAAGPTIAAASCSVVEPTSGRYWGAINGPVNGDVISPATIYVLSYFPSSKVIAWSTYDCTFQYSGTSSTFNPIAFRVYQGQVYVYASIGNSVSGLLYGIFVYGGTNNLTYDETTLTVQTPFLDCGAPGNRKTSFNVDCLMTGNWTISGNMNILNQNISNFKTILSQNVPTSESNTFGWTDQGTHGSLLCTCSDASAVTLSALIWHFQVEDYL